MTIPLKTIGLKKRGCLQWIAVLILTLFVVHSAEGQQLHWRQIGGVASFYPSVMAISPNGTAYLATPPGYEENGGALFSSVDEGRQWSVVAKLPQGTVATSLVSLDDSVLLARFTPNAHGYAQGDIHGIWRSSDAGKTWQQSIVRDANGFASQSVVSVSSGLAIVHEGDSLFLSRDLGLSWQRLQWPMDGARVFTIGTIGQDQFCISLNGAFYHTRDFVGWRQSLPTGYASISKASGNQSGVICAICGNDSLFISTDDGISWRKQARSASDVVCFPNGHIIANDGYNCTRSTDLGATWHYIQPGLSGTQSFVSIDSAGALFMQGDVSMVRIGDKDSVGVDCTPVNVPAAQLVAGRSGTVLYWDVNKLSYIASTDRGRSWNPTPPVGMRGGPYWISYDVHDGFIAACTYGDADGYGDRINFQTLLYSRNGGSWGESAQMPTDSRVSHSPYPLGFDHDGGLYFIRRDRLIITRDNGLTYQVIPTTLDSTANYSPMIGLPDGTIMLGVKGGIQESTDMGVTWQFVGAARFDNPITSIACDSSGTLMACTATDGVFQSTDEGAHWHKLSGGLPSDTSVNMLCYSSEGFWLAATNAGVFTLQQGATQWKSANDGLEDLDILSVEIGARGEYFAGTSVQGVFASLPSAGVSPSSESMAGLKISGYPNPSSQELNICIDLPHSGPCDVNLLDSQGKISRTIEAGETEMGIHNYRVVHGLLPAGDYYLQVAFGGTSTVLPLIFEH